MDLATIGAQIAIAGGVFLLVAALLSSFWWSKRSRWEKCEGVIESLEERPDPGEPGSFFSITISGEYRGEAFRFTSSEKYFREPEVGQTVPVFHDPRSRRFFEASGFSVLLAVVGSAIAGLVLLVLGCLAL